MEINGSNNFLQTNQSVYNEPNNKEIKGSNNFLHTNQSVYNEQKNKEINGSNNFLQKNTLWEKEKWIHHLSICHTVKLNPSNVKRIGSFRYTVHSSFRYTDLS